MNVLVTESDIEDYPGYVDPWCRIRKDFRSWPQYPETEKLEGDRDLVCNKYKRLYCKNKRNKTFPWRVFVIASKMMLSLLRVILFINWHTECRLTDTKWIKPGQVAWDWWNANNIYGVDFRAGINNDTYKYYIDFASRNGIEYIILDEGWYTLGNVLEQVPGINVQELCKYAESKNVGIYPVGCMEIILG